MYIFWQDTAARGEPIQAATCCNTCKGYSSCTGISSRSNSSIVMGCCNSVHFASAIMFTLLVKLLNLRLIYCDIVSGIIFFSFFPSHFCKSQYVIICAICFHMSLIPFTCAMEFFLLPSFFLLIILFYLLSIYLFL